MEITSTVARYIAHTRFEDIPGEVITKAKEILMDTLGCGIGGSVTVPARMVIETIMELGGKPEATLFGHGGRVNCVWTGFANSILVDILDYEETLICHPSATIVPAALAVAERQHASGRDLLTAMVVGYEVALRIGAAIRPTPQVSSQVAVMYSFLSFGAAAAASKLLRLDEEKVRHSLGYTGATTPVPTWITKWPRPLHYVKNDFGEQTRAGIMGALLAQKGFLAPYPILDHHLGFWKMIGSDRCEGSIMTQGLSKEYRILSDTYKPYPSCRWNHTSMDMVAELMAESGASCDDIEQITVKTFTEMAHWFADYRPSNIVDAEFSLPYAIAMIVSKEKPGPGWYSEEMMKRDEIKELADRVKVEADPDADREFYEVGGYPSQVEINLKDGRVLKRKASFARGDPRKPMTRREIVDKFLQLAVPIIGSKAAQEVMKLIENLDKMEDISELARRLSP